MSVLPSDLAVYNSLLSPAYDGAATLSAAVTTTTQTTVAAVFLVLANSLSRLILKFCG